MKDATQGWCPILPMWKESTLSRDNWLFATSIIWLIVIVAVTLHVFFAY
jgi:hypothetical protein